MGRKTRRRWDSTSPPQKFIPAMRRRGRRRRRRKKRERSNSSTTQTGYSRMLTHVSNGLRGAVYAQITHVKRAWSTRARVYTRGRKQERAVKTAVKERGRQYRVPARIRLNCRSFLGTMRRIPDRFVQTALIYGGFSFRKSPAS